MPINQEWATPILRQLNFWRENGIKEPKYYSNCVRKLSWKRIYWLMVKWMPFNFLKVLPGKGECCTFWSHKNNESENMVDISVFLIVLWLFPHLRPSFGPEERIAKKSEWYLSCCKWYIWDKMSLEILVYSSIWQIMMSLFHFAPESPFSILKFTGFFTFMTSKYMIKWTQFFSSAAHFIAYTAMSSQSNIILICKWINVSMLRHRKSYGGFKLEILSLAVLGSRKAFLTFSRKTKTSTY